MLATTALGVAAEPPSLPRPVALHRDVRPILAENGLAGHDLDAGPHPEGLDNREGRLAPRARGPAVVADPPAAGESLNPRQIHTLRRGLREQPEGRRHWAYQPPVATPAPAAHGGFVRNAIDRFVLAALDAQGLAPAPEADKVTLIRRLTFDLTGLPPSPVEVDAFLADTRPDAYERLVDRLLASPRHGERLAAWWLDLVRYADTTGYHGDTHRDVSLYRDWVIRAFNANLPFDRFTIEQLAGDLLPDATDSQRIASGYNMLLMTTQEPGAQPREYVARYAADRVRNAATVWLGTTLACAQCHDHKYDPFTSRDFYRFAAFFADIQESPTSTPEATRFPTPTQTAAVQALDAAIARWRKVLDTPTKALSLAQAAWEQSARRDPPEWTVVRPSRAESEGGATLSVRDDGSIAVAGASPARDVYRIAGTAPAPRLTGLRLELLPDGALPGVGPGRGPDGDVVLSELELTTLGREPGRVTWSAATATHAQGGFPVAAAIDGNPATGWSIAPEFGRPNQAVFEARDDFGPGAGADPPATLVLTLRFQQGDHRALGRFRIAVTASSRPLGAGAIPAKVRRLLEVPDSERSQAERDELGAYYRSIAPALQPARDALAAARHERAAIEAAAPRTLVTRAGPPRAVRILPQGDWLDESGPLVGPALPASLSGAQAPAPASAPGDDPPARARATRLDLARWLVSADHPLTARVLVNRLWALLFGRGLVATLDDFGTQGAPPTHPELLDGLARALVEDGWDVRRLIREMVTSGTYRRDSRASESLRRRDPENRWLARQGRFRLDAEVVRDIALATSGLLFERIGGPSAHPYQPAGYWSHLSFPRREYVADHGAGLYRRGLYTEWCRTFLHPSLLAFDAPSREECTVRRHRSNTPNQALVLLNDPTHVEAARVLAERTVRGGGRDTSERLRFLYRTVLSRPPRHDESTILSALLARHRAQFRTDRAAALALIQTGARPAAADLDPAELAAWTSVTRAVLNLSETITRY